MKRSSKKTRTFLLAGYLLLALAAAAGARLTSTRSFAMPAGAEKPSFGAPRSHAMPLGSSSLGVER